MKKLNTNVVQTIASASVLTPPAGCVTIFADTDNKMKQKDSAWVVTDLTATWWGGGWWLTYRQTFAITSLQ